MKGGTHFAACVAMAFVCSLPQSFSFSSLSVSPFPATNLAFRCSPSISSISHKRVIALRGRDARVQPAMNLFDGIASKLKESVSDLTKEVKVQHILVESESQAVEIRKKISKEGLETFGKYAQTYSTCGSAKKAPDAKLAQLRGLPGEMVFRKGQTDKAFETAAFEGKVGTVQGPVKTKFGYHLILVNERSEGLGGGEEGGSRADADASAQEEEESKQTESEATEMSKSASKKQLKAKKKRAK